MATGVVSWSQTAASNATADSTVNWQEGQAPSSINDSARAVMASVAKYRDDISGAIATGGTSTAYTVTSYQVFPSLTAMHGQMIAFTPHATSGGTATLNVDSLGAKPLRSAPSVEILAGTLVQGTPYAATYNNTDGVFYLQSFYGNPYNVPIGGLLDSVVGPPNSSFVYPYGQAVSRTTYATLFASVSTTFGSGDGSTTFNLPDLRGRVVAGKDDMGGTAAGRLTSTYFGTPATALGAAGGAESETLTQAQLPAFKPAITITDPGHQHTYTTTSALQQVAGGSGTACWAGGTTANTNLVATGITAAFTNNLGSGNAHNNTQPTIVLYKILRVI